MGVLLNGFVLSVMCLIFFVRFVVVFLVLSKELNYDVVCEWFVVVCVVVVGDGVVVVVV